MSCLSCPCQFNWPIDTQGSKRDPVTSEKAWLDFAVRCLSRETVGRGRGQETVWGAACKPSWWDAEMGILWKNPTANPKDTKDVLLKKYKALDRHLREEGRFPKELEEESKLFNEGKNKELFLLTSLTSLLGKVTGVHSATLDAATKTENLKAEINQSLLKDIKSCLKSTLSAIENLVCNSSSRKVHIQETVKRSYDSSLPENNGPISVEKIPKLSTPFSTTSSSPSFENNIHQTQNLSPHSSATVAQISAYSKKLIKKHKELNKFIHHTASDTGVSKYKSILPSPNVVPSSALIVPEITKSSSPPIASNASPIYVNLSQEQFEILNKGQPIPFLNTMVQSSSSCQISSVSTVQSLNQDTVSLSPIHETNSFFSTENFTADNLKILGNNDGNLHTDNFFNCFETHNSDKNKNENECVSTSITPLYPLGPLNEQSNVETIAPFGVNTSTEHFENDILPYVASSNTSIHSESNGSLSGKQADEQVNLSPKTSEDRGYGSDESAIDNIDIDELFSFEEQSQLWEDDGSYLLDRFLTDLDESI